MLNRTILGLGTAAVMALTVQSSNAAVIVNYALTTNFNATTTASGVSASAITLAAGGNIKDNGIQTWGGWTPNAWGVGNNSNVSASTAVSLNAYFSITLTPDAGKKINVDSFSWDASRSATSTARGYLVYSSVDGYANPIESVDVTNFRYTMQTDTVTLSSNSAFQNLPSALTFRVYVYTNNGGNTARTLETRNLTVNGTVSNAVVPEPASLALLALGGLLMLPRRRTV